MENHSDIEIPRKYEFRKGESMSLRRNPNSETLVFDEKCRENTPIQKLHGKKKVISHESTTLVTYLSNLCNENGSEKRGKKKREIRYFRLARKIRG